MFVRTIVQHILLTLISKSHQKKKSFGFVTSMGFELKFSFKSVFEIFILVNRQWFSVQVKQLFYA